jgi:hypothetical protein
VTNQGTDPAGADELWTPGRAAAYLNSGGVDLGFTSRRVADMIRRDVLPGAQTQAQGWHRTPASAVRRLRYEQLTSIGRSDPDWPATDGQADAPDAGAQAPREV